MSVKVYNFNDYSVSVTIGSDSYPIMPKSEAILPSKPEVLPTRVVVVEEVSTKAAKSN